MRKWGKKELAVLAYTGTVRCLLTLPVGSGIQNLWYEFFFFLSFALNGIATLPAAKFDLK